MTDTVTYDKMDPEVKVKWLEALRSGKFTQGVGYLKTYSGCNCCLGVLAEVNGVPSAPAPDDYEEGSYFYSFPDRERSEFDDNIQTPDNYCGIHPKARNHLMNMNDGSESVDRRYSFAEIADYIEENL